jgi:uncharacterized protein YfbU (UPF0304 family)
MEAGGIKGEIDPSFVKTVIAGDDLWALRWKYGGLFHGEGPSDEIVDETAKIMTMCRVIENSIAQLTPEELASIPDHQQQVFVGFDGNEESHYGVAVMFVERLDRYAEWEGRPLNSHHNTLDRYRSMKRVFDHTKTSHRGLLDLAGIQAILAA